MSTPTRKRRTKTIVRWVNYYPGGPDGMLSDIMRETKEEARFHASSDYATQIELRIEVPLKRKAKTL